MQTVCDLLSPKGVELDFGKANVIELEEDRWGRCSYTEVKLEFLKYYPRESIDMLLRKSVEAINELIEVYMYVSERYYLSRLRVSDLLHYNYYVIAGENKLSDTHRFFEENVHLGKAYIQDPVIENKVKEALRQGGIKLWQRLIISARRNFANEEYMRAIIDAVTALELVLYKYILLYNKSKGIPEDKTRDTLIKIGLTGSLDITLRQIAPINAFTDEVLRGCKGAITKRNRILHDGFSEASESDAAQAIESVVRLNKRIEGLISEFDAAYA